MKYTLTLLAFALSVTIPASAQVAYYLVSPTLHCAASVSLPNGPTVADQIDSFAFSGSEVLSGSTQRIALQNFAISKAVDICSGPLATAFIASTPFQTLTIYATKSATKIPFLGITLKDVFINQYSLTNNATTMRPTEQIGLKFQSVAITVVSGTDNKISSWSYDSSTNTIGNIGPDLNVRFDPSDLTP